MGTDIHLHLEVQIDGQWHHYGAPSVGRYYDLFGLMAGVRGDQEPIVQPRGLPVDASALTRLCFKRDDGHTASWLEAEEIARLEHEWALLGKHTRHGGRARADINRDLEHSVLHTYLFGNSWAGFALYRNDYPREIEDVRWVFWFDS